jgi:lysophospholipase L1-like esterase
VSMAEGRGGSRPIPGRRAVRGGQLLSVLLLVVSAVMASASAAQTFGAQGAGVAEGASPSGENAIPPPPYIDLGANVIEFEGRAAIARLSARWQHPGGAPVVIAHFGDSHVQKGYLPEAARLALQERAGSGGRGMVFPYAIAKTYSQNDLDSTFTGVWRTANSIQQPPKLPVGISGFVAVTSDPSASITLTFKRPLDPGPKRIRIFYRAVGSPYRITLQTGVLFPSQVAPVTPDGETSVAEFDLDQVSDSIELQVSPTEPEAGEFALHGLSIENANSAGLIYHNLGVGGAVFDAVNEQTWFQQELRVINPDLVILDYGTNDIVFTNAVPAVFEDQVKLAIARVRAATPGASILLTSTQDMTFKGRDITAAADLSALMRRIAVETGCLYWDWYRVSGGPGSRPLWRADMLSGSDGIHLTSRGYQLKGRLLAAAILHTIDFAAANPQATALLAPAARSDDPIGELLREHDLDAGSPQGADPPPH